MKNEITLSLLGSERENHAKLLLAVLEFYDYRPVETARSLGISDRTLRSRIDRLREEGHEIRMGPLPGPTKKCVVVESIKNADLDERRAALNRLLRLPE